MSMNFPREQFERAELVRPSDGYARQPESVDDWFPRLGLHDATRTGPGEWRAMATWPGNRMIWKTARHDEIAGRMYGLYLDADKAGNRDRANHFSERLEAWQAAHMERWPETRPHYVTVDSCGSILCDGMEQHEWGPLDFIALAMGYRTEIGTLDTDRAWSFVKGEDVAKPASVWNSAGDLEGVPIPPREWVIDGLVPDKTATLLTGDGGTGKSLLALQLAVSVAAGIDWLGLPTERGPVLYLSAEDDHDELHRRLASILTATRLGFRDVADLFIRSTVGSGALLAERGRTSLNPTPLAEDIEANAQRLSARLIVLDTLANLFPGDENDRAQVTQFVDIVKGIGLRCGCAMVVLAHPSKSAMESGEGYSGNTAWNAAVRSRLFFRRVTDNGYEPDPDARVLRTMKANYGPVGNEISLTYAGGVFAPVAAETAIDRQASTARAERVFLSLLSLMCSQGRKVNHAGGPTYAPNVFAAHPQSEGVSKRAFRTAMENLLASGRIRVSEDGPASKRRQFLEVAE